MYISAVFPVLIRYNQVFSSFVIAAVIHAYSSHLTVLKYCKYSSNIFPY